MEALLQQVMNRRDAGIFQSYPNERVGCDVRPLRQIPLPKVPVT
jgi:hypothetical protein